MADWAILRESVEILGAVALGWAIARRAPEGIEQGLWLRARRRIAKWRRRAAFP